MCKSRLAVFGLVAVLLLAFHGMASAGIVDPCKSYCELQAADGGPPSPPCCLFVCPQGDTPAFCNQPSTGNGWRIRVCVFEADGTPVPAVPAADFWLIDCDPLADIALCAGSASTAADSVTNANGYTTLCGSVLAGGGCVDGLATVVQGFVLLDTLTCTTPICKPINVRSPDISGDLCVDLIDLAVFAGSYPPQAYDACCDFDCNGIVDVVDLAQFAFHFGPPGHECSPPGCP